MKILHIGPVKTVSRHGEEDFEVYPGLAPDGPSRSILGLSKALADAGMDVSVLSTKPFDELDKKTLGNVRFLRSFTGYKYNPFVSAPSWMDLIRKEFGIPDLVNFHDVYDLFSCSLAAELKKLNVKYIVTPRGGLRKLSQQREAWKKKLANYLFFRRYLRGAVLIHTLSENEKNDVEIFDPGLRTSIVPNGVPKEFLTFSEKFNAVPQKNEHEINIGFVGQIYVKIKGIDLLLSAIKVLQARGISKNLRFVLVGPTPNRIDQRWMNNLMQKIPIPEKVQLIGPKYGREKWEYLNNLDVLVLPSRTEGMPVVVLEAMVCGKPCLVSEGSSMRSIIVEAKAGWGFEGTVDSLIEKLVEISNTPREKLLEYGLNAKAYVEKHLTWDRVVGKYLAMIDEVLT